MAFQGFELNLLEWGLQDYVDSFKGKYPKIYKSVIFSIGLLISGLQFTYIFHKFQRLNFANRKIYGTLRWIYILTLSFHHF